MARLAAFLRGINVGGHVVKNDQLKKIFGKAGCDDVQTFIASGNVVFSSKSRSMPALEKKIEGELRKALGYEVRVFVRTEDEVLAVAAHQPFNAAQLKDARSVYVGFLPAAPSAATVKALMKLRTETDEFHVKGREVYWLLRAPFTDSKVNYNTFERTLAAPATFRVTRTINRLAEKYGFGAG